MKALTFFLLLGTAWAAAPQGPVIHSRVDKHAVFIGETVRYSIIVSCPLDTELDTSGFTASLDPFLVRDSRVRINTLFGKKRLSARYLLTTYTTGEHRLNKATLRYRLRGASDWKEAVVPEQAIEVKSAIEGASLEPKDIKGPLRLIRRHRLLLATLLIGCLGAIVWLLVKRRRMALPSPEPPQPAHMIAYGQLKALKEKDLIKRGLIKEYFTELSRIIRHYLENRFGLKAPEMTTEEFLLFAQGGERLADGHTRLLKAFLERCDLVKFAKHRPGGLEGENAFDSAKTFIDETKKEDDLS